MNQGGEPDPASGDLAARVALLVQDVEDFPEPGVRFRDVLPVLADPSTFRAVVDHVAGRRAQWGFDIVVGVDARGFLLAGAIAYAAGCPLVVIRKAGKLPGPIQSAPYALEYGTGTLQIQRGALPPGARVLLVDDVLATGGTLAAAAGLLATAGAGSCRCWVLVELVELAGRRRIPDVLDALLIL
ncbi:MAG: adenine phosphoribosyltransferase [Geodermatophilaceae bacterium]|nr:adenine phosphoribosyltransferase [Geodermatophilaceae bacterium]